jgi:two-component system OmpR family sensor kinase
MAETVPDDIGDNVPDNQILIMGNEQALRRVLANLVANALRHTPPNSPIELVFGKHAGWAIVQVCDHGPGIPQEQRARVFDRFYRLDGSRTRDLGGSGLGLAIVAALVTAHGGFVEVLDTPGGGATFQVMLPLPSTEPGI